MRVTRVAAQPKPAVTAQGPASRGRETVLLVLVSCLLAYGFSQVYRSRDRLLDNAERRLAERQTLLLARLMPASEISRYLDSYSNSGQRQLVSMKIADLLRHELPANVGALARLRLTRAET